MNRRRQQLTEGTEDDLNLVNVQDEGGLLETESNEEFDLELESDTSDDEGVTEGQSEDELDLDLDDLIPSVSNPVRRIPEAGVLSIVNSDNGKRVVISSEIAVRLQLTESVQIGYVPNYIVIASQLGKGYTTYGLKSYGAKKLIYCSELVQEATKYHRLDFTERTSITFSEVSYKTLNGNKVALIHVKSV